MNNNRRQFFKTLGTAAAGVAAVSPLIASTEAAVAPNKGEFPVTFLHALALENALAGPIRDFDGGDAFSPVISEPVDISGIVRKHLGPVSFEDIALSCGAGMSPATYKWISDLLARDPASHNGAILSADASGVFRTQLTFVSALLTEVVFPELDANSKDPAFLSLKLNPELTRIDPPSFTNMGPGGKAEKNKAWLSSNFRIKIGAVSEAATQRVTKIEAITIKQKIVDGSVGETRDPETQLEPLNIDSIVLTVPERFAQPFLDWHRQFVVLGNNGSGSETFATIEYLTPKGEVLFTLNFNGVGIYRASRVGENDKKSGLRSVRVELYAETASFFVGTPEPA